ncbi:MAG: BTAD domain-containing putative transcriptional regulator, partial [Thermoanaerobaculia bacterium]
RVYRRLADALRRELDVEPEPETAALAARAREGRKAGRMKAGRMKDEG